VVEFEGPLAGARRRAFRLDLLSAELLDCCGIDLAECGEAEHDPATLRVCGHQVFTTRLFR
jgi:hypothetical protein